MIKLLLVDDNEDARDVQSLIFSSHGYEVMTAENGVDAMEYIRQSRPDLIITDVLMPKMDGYELCRRLKTDKTLKDIPIVFYSAHYLDPQDEKMARDLGVVQLIQKPMDTAEFLRIIDGIVQQFGKSEFLPPVWLFKEDLDFERKHEQRLTEMLYKKLGELEQTRSMLKNALEGTIATVALAVEARDPSTSGHQRRVATLAEAIAREMKLEEKQVEGIRMGATIHDIGKIQIPAEILGKPAKLSDIEIHLVQEHTTVGYNILKVVAFPWPVAQIAYQHHERMDGSGYPQGLKGDEISLEARIVAVADVVEAMLSHRPYREAQAVEVALEEIKQRRGTLYDPLVVDACLSLFQLKNFRLESEGRRDTDAGIRAQ
ncbi:MAG: phosphohydrolase [Zetaproteobacteria bacterium CG_4_9_14_3_um_filter_49_83]|nr:MAG: hypothetical protein AUJ56_03490 [Zetaproteobacteria bacterium CG1_02_49_23]PIQ34689.1 MAG: phosphohydrolase [Zetaproteobacteria bacterium CG17_big_fil_post_rev_8_21_14_2_50_50_13]PIY54984.1 MAG: phosphohydrolase [Zetaproteobacteria bacterium CG_4_10_14_0_8_um_filter_49_80]PJA34272.1 MAG: phosphohydrolase [Zetaproteobacteria bacterium CG_4_9_14_3_um_filter_49_83]